MLGSVKDDKGLLPFGKRIRRAVETSNDVFDVVGRKITVSCGVSRLEENDDLERIMKCADDAMYESKSSGRNCTRLALSSAMHGNKGDSKIPDLTSIDPTTN